MPPLCALVEQDVFRNLLIKFLHKPVMDFLRLEPCPPEEAASLPLEIEISIGAVHCGTPWLAEH